MVLVAQAAGTLAHHLSWHTFADFVVVFSLVWIAWVNGTQYHELHAREDGRSRVALFGQMLIIAPLAAFTGNAAGSDGSAFALTYAGLMVVFIWLWWSVRRIDPPEYHATTATYLATMLVTTAVMGASAFVTSDSARVLVWAGLVVTWIAGVLLMRRIAFRRNAVTTVAATPSLVERFDLFVIIVLGEVVVGVVNGLGAAPNSAAYLVTSLAGMLLAFGLWWMYFDFAGQRAPNANQTRWMLSQLPLTLGIAAVGACMVNLIEHAADGRTHATAAWVTASSYSIALAALISLYTTLEIATQHRRLYRKLVLNAAATIPLAFALAAWRPQAGALLGILALLLTALWWISVHVWMRSDVQVRSWPPGLRRR